MPHIMSDVMFNVLSVFMSDVMYQVQRRTQCHVVEVMNPPSQRQVKLKYKVHMVLFKSSCLLV